MVPQGIFGLGTPELIVILVVVVVLFGGAKLAGLGKASGQAIREFREEIGSGKSDAVGSSAGAGSVPSDEVTHTQTPSTRQ